MKNNYARICWAIAGFILAGQVPPGRAQMPAMEMAGMENSVGFLSSGTSIEPKSTSESSPMVHKTLGDWEVMVHANAALAAIQQSGPRGHDKLFSGNWLMPAVSRQFGRQRVELRTMLSLEPATVTQRRYPLLFQTGETANGLPVIDGQHPHDFVMELAARYELRFDEKTRLFAYGGLLGEPALGPAAFPHRASNSENPLATLGHHEQDSTHISSDVVTLGIVHRRIQLEASTFHGREPDENRWNIDQGKPDSFASRLSVSLNNHLAGQFSIGRINNREALHPTEDTLRTTASIHHHIAFSSGHVASSLIWGRNKELDGHDAPRIFNSYLAESTVNYRKLNWTWFRIENADRNRTIQVGEIPEALTTEEQSIGRVQAYTVGYERDLPVRLSIMSLGVNVGIGAQWTTYSAPRQLQEIYGNRPASLVVFLRLRPVGNMTDHMKLMHRR